MYLNIKTLNLINEFISFYNTTSDNIQKVFDEYFLGSNTENPISFDRYIEILTDSISKRTFIGHRTIKYTRISPKDKVHSKVSIFTIPQDYIESLWIQKNAYDVGTYPKITIENYEYFSDIVFLIHPDVIYNSIDHDKMIMLASAWYDYSIEHFLGYKYSKFIYRYANKHNIIHSTFNLDNGQLKKTCIYNNYIFGPKILCINDED